MLGVWVCLTVTAALKREKEDRGGSYWWKLELLWVCVCVSVESERVNVKAEKLSKVNKVKENLHLHLHVSFLVSPEGLLQCCSQRRFQVYNH